MKTAIVSALLLVLSFPVALAFSSIPEAVQNSFSNMYPAVKSPFWEIRPEGIVATFRDEEGLKKAFFSEAGEWMETRIRLGLDQLPHGVQLFIKNNYRDAEISFCGKVNTPQGVRYRVESELPDRVLLKNLDAEGQLIDEHAILFSTAVAVPVRGR